MIGVLPAPVGAIQLVPVVRIADAFPMSEVGADRRAPVVQIASALPTTGVTAVKPLHQSNPLTLGQKDPKRQAGRWHLSAAVTQTRTAR